MKKNLQPSKQRLDKLMSSMGYGTRNEIKQFLKQGRIQHIAHESLSPEKKVSHQELLWDGEPLDPPHGIIILMHKPRGIVCSHDINEGRLIYDLLPERWRLRDPKISTIGRLDKDTSGLILLTDNGQLLHELTSPKHHVNKTYSVTLSRPLDQETIQTFNSGSLMLNGETTPCKPAILDIIDSTHAIITLQEGRYHQVRRMFAAVGNHVETLERIKFGPLDLQGLAPGEYKLISKEELA